MRRHTTISIWLGMILATACTADVGDLGAAATDSTPGPTECLRDHELIVRTTSGDAVDVATAVVRIGDAHLDILVEARPGWELGNAYATVVREGVVSVFSANETPWSTGYLQLVHLAIPLDEAGLLCGDVFKLVIQLYARDTETRTRRFASAVAPFQMGSGENGWYDYHQLCCDEPSRGCTRTQGYWKNHEDWPVDELKLGTRTYTQAELLAILTTAPRGDASLILVHQLVAAELNRESGASSIPAIGAAQSWMSTYGDALPYDIAPRTEPGREATSLADALAAYNEGRDGPGHCDHRPSDDHHPVPPPPSSVP